MYAPPSFRSASIVVTLVLLFAFGLMLSFENQQRPYLDQFSDFTRQDAIWSGFAAMEEFHHLHYAADAAIRNPTSDNLAAARLRYDIFAGRISAFQNGVFTALTENNPEFQQNIREIDEWVTKTDAELSDQPLSLEQVTQLDRDLMGLENNLKTVVRSIQGQFSKQMEINKLRIEKLAAYRIGLYVLIFMTMSGFALFALRNLWASQQRQVALLAAQEKALQANEAKSRFLANISHEMRTPLTTVLGYSEQMQQDPTLSAKQAQNLTHIHNASRYLLSLIGNVLDMSKIEAGRVSLSHDIVSIADLINELEGMFWHQAKLKGLRLELIVDETMPSYVALDGGKLRQILVNLLGNAIKFSDQGTVKLQLSCETLSDDQLMISCTVSDQGLGIAESERNDVFHPFSQTASGRHVGGTGLGLALSQEYARYMGGDIRFESEPQHGSRFIATVEAECCAAPERCYPNAERNLSGYQLLVVEDQLVNRELLRELLERFGATVFEAENGLQALDVLQQHPDIALVLMDRNMPQLDGLQTTQTMRLRGLKQPVLMVSAGLPPSPEEMHEHGLDAWLSKPFTSDQLHLNINQLLQLEPNVQAPDAVAPEASVTPLLDHHRACQDLGYSAQRYHLMAHKGLDRVAEIIDSWPSLAQNDDRIRLAHSAKGISRQIGAEQLGEYFAQLEGNSAQHADPTLHQAQELLLATRQYLNSLAS